MSTCVQHLEDLIKHGCGPVLVYNLGNTGHTNIDSKLLNTPFLELPATVVVGEALARAARVGGEGLDAAAVVVGEGLRGAAVAVGD